MAQKIGSLIISLALESGAFRSGLDASQKELRDATKRMQALGESMRGIGQNLSLAVTAPLTALAAKSVQGFVEQEQAMAQVRAALQSMGTVSGKTAAELSKTADALEMRSLFDADVILKQVTANLLTFGNVSGAMFDRAQQAALDMAARLGGEPQAAAIQLGKALNDPVKGVSALTKVGIQFTAAQKAMIAEMVKTGNVAGAQGIIMAEVEKQFSGAAAAAADTSPWRQAQVALGQAGDAIGAQLLPMIKPLTEAIVSVLETFNQLSPGMQKAAVIFGVVAAAAGPVLIGIGALVSAMAPLSGVLTLAVAGGFGAISANLIALAATIAGALPVVGAIAAVGALIWANWDRIGPVFAELGARISSAIGPQVQAVVAAFGKVLTELWQGPLGDLLKEALQLLGSLGIGATKIFGEVLVRSATAALEVLRGFFDYLGQVIKFIGQVLTGDFVGAWETAKTAIVGVARTLVNALSLILTGEMDKIWNWVTGKIEVVRKAFYNLYDAVVGNSYVPDMVDGIAAQMARLDAVMVNPAKRATDKAAEAFRNLAAEVQPIMDRLFPEAQALADYRKDLATINRAEKGKAIDSAQAEEARRRLRGLVPGEIEIATKLLPEGFETTSRVMARARAELDKLYGAANDNGKKIGAVNVRLAKSFKDMANDTLGALQNLSSSLRGGGFLDILGSVVGLLTQLGSIGLFGKTIATNINKPIPAYAGGTGYHPGGLALVGERGPELVSLPRGSAVTPNHALRGGGGGVRVEVIPSPWFDVRVQQNIEAEAPAIAGAGAAAGMRRASYAQRRRLG